MDNNDSFPISLLELLSKQTSATSFEQNIPESSKALDKERLQNCLKKPILPNEISVSRDIDEVLKALIANRSVGATTYVQNPRVFEYVVPRAHGELDLLTLLHNSINAKGGTSMVEYIDIESLDVLIKAVQEYQNDLATNKQILLNAANVCDVAMGSDPIAQKHIARLNEALEELQKTAQIAADVAMALIEDRRRAVEVYEEC